MNKSSKYSVWVAVATLVVLSASIFLLTFKGPGREKSSLEYIGLFKEVIGLIKAKYVEPVDSKKLMISAVNGMLTALDPHNAYMTPDSFNDMQVQMSGAFGGVGIEITIRDGKLMVISPLEDTPAYHAGIKPGDLIWMIDNSLTRFMNINDAVKRMRGPKGSGVVLTIIREGVAKPLVFKLKRDIIHIRSVKARTLEKGFGYIRIAQFQESTRSEFVKALADLHRGNSGVLKGLVLDLRNNPGGVVDAAVEVAGRFVGGDLKGGLIVSMKGREPSSKKDYFASVGEKEPVYPMVILINGGSASASEIVAGALQDYKRAVIVGTQSFGKGSVQSVIPLEDGAGLKLTTSMYYTPKGRSIQAKGITPDLEIGETEIGTTPKGEVHDFREEDLDGHILPPAQQNEKNKKTEKPSSGHRDETKIKDYQLLRALDLLKGMGLMSELK